MSACYAGIDVSKATLDGFLRPSMTAFQFPNTPQGREDLVARLRPLGLTQVVCEASGGYEQPLRLALEHAGIPCAVAAPKEVWMFLRGLGAKAKTDRQDAKGLAHYAELTPPSPQVPSDPAREALDALVKRRSQVVGLMIQERGHAEQATGRAATDIAESLQALQARKQGLDTAIAAAIQAEKALAELDRRLQTVPGVGPVVSQVLLTLLPELGHRTQKQLAALAGVAPYARESGTFKGMRWIQGGRAEVRHKLYLAVWASIKATSLVATWRRHFLDQGKKFKVAMVACMRKLLGLLNVMVRDSLDWNDLTTVKEAQSAAPH